MSAKRKSPVGSKKYRTKRISISHDNLSLSEKKRWTMVKLNPSAKSHTVCYYDPDTKEWDDCHEVSAA
jgi:hypothetical protein